MLVFHHIGIATKDINKTFQWIQVNFKVLKFSKKIYDPNQKAYLMFITTQDVNIELISGEIVEKLIKKNITYYHICYEVEDIHKAIHSINGSMLISNPAPAPLFEQRKVAFLLTPLGIIELLESEVKA